MKLKRFVAVLLSLVVAGLAPGFEAYAAAGDMTRAPKGNEGPSAIIRVPLASASAPLGSGLAPGSQASNLAPQAVLNATPQVPALNPAASQAPGLRSRPESAGQDSIAAAGLGREAQKLSSISAPAASPRGPLAASAAAPSSGNAADALTATEAQREESGALFDASGTRKVLLPVGTKQDEATVRSIVDRVAQHTRSNAVDTGNSGAAVAAAKNEAVSADKLAEARASEQAAQGGWKKTLAKIWEAVKALPTSFKYFVAASSLLAMANEGISIITSVYGITQFGLTAGILSQATNLVFRIPGSLVAAKWVKKFDPKRIYMATTALQAVLLLSLPLGAWYFGSAALTLAIGTHSVAVPLFLAQYFLIQAVQGLIYGATRGMAESAIMPRLLGDADAKRLEIGGFLWMAAVEFLCLVTAFGLSPAVRALLGSNIALAVFSGIQFLSLFLFWKIELSEPKAAAGGEKKPEETSPGDEASKKTARVDSLPTREYIPYVMSSLLHFTFYSLFSGLFATNTFDNQFMADLATGSYDTGSMVIGITAAVPALLASLEPASQAGGNEAKKKPGLMDRLSLKSWFGVAGLAAAAYIWTGFLGLQWINLAFAATLGAMTTVNRTKWMASYQSRLKPEHHARVGASLSSVSTLVALIPFAVMSLGKVYGVAPLRLLYGIAIGASIAIAASWALTHQPEEP